MELPKPLRGLGEKLFKLTSGGKKVVTEQPLDPNFYAAAEARCKGMLVRFYTNPEGLTALGQVGRATADFRKAGEQHLRLEDELGINTNIVPHFTADIKAARDRGEEITILTREKVLSLVRPERRPAVEGAALLEAKRVLLERLKEEDLNRDHRNAATALLMKIEEHLKRDIPLTGENPQKPT